MFFFEQTTFFTNIFGNIAESCMVERLLCINLHFSPARAKESVLKNHLRQARFAIAAH